MTLGFLTSAGGVQEMLPSELAAWRRDRFGGKNKILDMLGFCVDSHAEGTRGSQTCGTESSEQDSGLQTQTWRCPGTGEV